MVIILLNSSTIPPTGVLAQAEAPCPGEIPFLVEFTQPTAKSMLRLEQHRLFFFFFNDLLGFISLITEKCFFKSIEFQTKKYINLTNSSLN